jgi:hypothetical protein
MKRLFYSSCISFIFYVFDLAFIQQQKKNISSQITQKEKLGGLKKNRDLEKKNGIMQTKIFNFKSKNKKNYLKNKHFHHNLVFVFQFKIFTNTFENYSFLIIHWCFFFKFQSSTNEPLENCITR